MDKQEQSSIHSPTLSEKERQQIEEILGRKPSDLELQIFAIHWSKEVAVKNAVRWLHQTNIDFKTTHISGDDEDIGLLEISKNLTLAYKLHASSINSVSSFKNTPHPALISCGATPIGQFQKLHLDRFSDQKTLDFLAQQATDSDFKQALPKESEVLFHHGFHGQELVFQLDLGVLEKNALIAANACKESNVLFLIGLTKKIDHTTLEEEEDDIELEEEVVFSKDTFEPTKQATAGLLNALPTTPFSKLLQQEAVAGAIPVDANNLILAVTQFCGNARIGIQLNCPASVNLSTILTADQWLGQNANSYYLVSVEANQQDSFENALNKEAYPYAQIGQVIEEAKLSILKEEKECASIPIDMLLLSGGGANKFPPYSRPKYLKKIHHFSLKRKKSPSDLLKAAKKLFISPNNLSKQAFFGKQEKAIASAASIFQLPEQTRLLAVAVEGLPAQSFAEPFQAAVIAISTAMRKVLCSGGTPKVLTAALNFGDLYNPEIFWQFIHATKGIQEAAYHFKIPITASEVRSQFSEKESDVMAILPSVVLSVIGVVPTVEDQIPMAFQEHEDAIFVIGNPHENLDGSEYLQAVQNMPLSANPRIELHEEKELHHHIRLLQKKNLTDSMQEVSSGGLFMALMKSAMEKEMGFNIETIKTFRLDTFLFGESQSRILVSTSPDKEDDLLSYLITNNLNFAKLGEVFGNEIIINDKNFGNVAKWKDRHLNLLKEKVEKSLQKKQTKQEETPADVSL